MEDLGRLVLLDHVLTGNNLQQYGSHLSQVDQEQARCTPAQSARPDAAAPAQRHADRTWH